MSFLRAELTGEKIIDIEPPRATLEQAQLALSNRLELVRVDKDVLHVAETLARIDPGLQMFHDENQGVFVLYWKGAREKDGRVELVEDFIGAYTELDQRIVRLIERIDGQGRGRHDLQRGLDRLEAEKDAEHEWEQAQLVGEAGDRLRHAIRRDLNLEGSSVQLSSRGGEKARRDKRRREKAARKQNRSG